MTSHAEAFRVAARERGTRPRSRYPSSLRRLALAHLAQVRERGGTITLAAKDLGLDVSTLRTWAKAPDKPRRKRTDSAPSPAVVPIHVVPDEHGHEPVVKPPTRTPNVQPSSYLVHAGSYRIECSSAEAVAALLGVLS